VTEAVATLGAACARHGKPLLVGGIADQKLLASFTALGACPLRLTGTDTDMLYAGAAARAERFLTWHPPSP
jgi:hypothetical protein